MEDLVFEGGGLGVVDEEGGEEEGDDAGLFANMVAAAATTTPPAVVAAPTRVNGVGLWNSWTRNFKTPMLAFLDLMDNAVDAADVLSTTGKIVIQADERFHNGHEHDNDGRGGLAGLMLMNNSQKACKDIHQILEVYHSTKHDAAETVGENGVGLKQGCAALANLSFIVIRNDNDLYLGILARRLQRPEGVCLPSWHLGSVPDFTPQQMVDTAAQAQPDLAQCLAEYGGGDFHVGKQRLTEHLKHMLEHDTWAQERHVFMLILNQLVHGKEKKKLKSNPPPSSSSRNESSATLKPPPVSQPPAAALLPVVPHFQPAQLHGYAQHQQQRSFPDLSGSAMIPNHPSAIFAQGRTQYDMLAQRQRQILGGPQQAPGATTQQPQIMTQVQATFAQPKQPALPSDLAYAKQFMKELRGKLPRHYIHIPSSFYLRVDGKPVQFEYWQRRLVEMTQFQVQVVKNESFVEDTWGWRDVIHRQPEEWYNLTVYTGFDAERAKENNNNMAQLLVYSRKSGRHILTVDDARSSLGVSVGGSSFCQGLTIIVDDHDGKLPLNPTKQDLAFGEEENGESHKLNLFGWVGAVAWTYWMKCADVCGGMKHKETLSERIQNARKIPVHPGAAPMPLFESKFTKFLINNRADWKTSKFTKKPTIRPADRNSMAIEHGPQTLFRLDRSKVDEALLDNKSPKKRKLDAMVNPVISLLEDDDDDDNSDDMPAPQPAKSSAAGLIMEQVQSEVGVSEKATKWKKRASDRAQRIKELEAENKEKSEQLAKLNAGPQPGSWDESRLQTLRSKIMSLEREKGSLKKDQAAWQVERVQLKSQLASARAALSRAFETKSHKSHEEDESKHRHEAKNLKKLLDFEKAEKETLMKQNEVLSGKVEHLQQQLANVEQLGGRISSSSVPSDEEEW